MKKLLARVWQFVVWFFSQPKLTAEEQKEHEREIDEMERRGQVW